MYVYMCIAYIYTHIYIYSRGSKSRPPPEAGMGKVLSFVVISVSIL